MIGGDYNSQTYLSRGSVFALPSHLDTDSYSSGTLTTTSTTTTSFLSPINNSPTSVLSSTPALPSAVSSSITCGASPYTSHTSFWVDSISKSKVSWNTNYSINTYFSWVTSAMKTVTVQFSNDGSGNPSPSWGTIDLASNVLSFNVPYVSSDTSYTFTLNVQPDELPGISYLVSVKLNVVSWKVSNCNIWQSSDDDKWQVWNTGYTLSSYAWNSSTTSSSQSSTTSTTSATTSATSSQPSTQSNVSVSKEESTTANVANTGAMVAGAIGIVAASLTSALTMSSPQGMWSVLNQFQTLTFLLLTRAYFPEETSGSFTGLSQITNFSFDFMPFPNLDFLSGFLSWFNLPTPGNISSKLGLKSGSTFFNNISLFLNILIVVFIHIIFIIVKRLLNKRLDKRPIIKAIVERIYRLFTLWLYLRLIMEAYQFLLIWSWYEIYSFRSATNADIVSLAIAFMVFVLWIIFAKAVLALTIKEAKGVNDAKNTQDDKKSIFCELFDGTKDTKYSKYYSFMFIIRKALIIIFMAFLTDLNIIIKVAFFVLVQLLYFLYIVSVRPLEKMKDNLIGVMNEALMLLLASMLFKFNQESDWTSPSKMVFFLSISIVNLLVSIICIGKL